MWELLIWDLVPRRLLLDSGLGWKEADLEAYIAKAAPTHGTIGIVLEMMLRQCQIEVAIHIVGRSCKLLQSQERVSQI